MASSTTKTQNIDVEPLKRGIVTLRIIGTTPLYQHRMSAKAKEQLIISESRRKSKDPFKTHPLEAFRDALEIRPDSGATACGLRVVSLKGAMCTAALAVKGVHKTDVQRLIFMPGNVVPLYGTPQIKMDTVRLSGMGRAPDLRTRPYFPKWGAEIEVHYVSPNLTLEGVVNLVANAGVVAGIGDFRQEKGAGNYGSFRVIAADEDDPEWDDLVLNHGIEAQEAAIKAPEPADDETRELLGFYWQQISKRKIA